MDSRKSGLTLIEVLAAIGLLSALLATIVIASARHSHQLRLAQDRLTAQEIADELLAQWLIDGRGVIDAPRGKVPGRSGGEWRLAGRIDPGLEAFGLHVGRLEILRSSADIALESEEPPVVLVSVEFASSSTITAEAAAQGVP